MQRPQVVALDIIGTTFSLETMRDRLGGLGLPQHALEIWFPAALRDAFALAAAGDFKPFGAVLDAGLQQLVAHHGLAAGAEERAAVLQGMKELEPHPDAGDAIDRIVAAGIRLVALSNGASAVTRSLLERAGLIGAFAHIVSVDDVQISKPRAEVYVHAARVAAVAPEDMLLLASHAWDVNGAKAAGLRAGFVARHGAYPGIMRAPDLQGASLLEAARAVAALPR